MENNLQENQQQDLLGDVGGEVDTSEYDAQVRKARNWLFVVAGIQLLAGLIEVYNTPDDLKLIVLGIHGVIIIIFVALALWSNKKAFEALVTAIVVYALIYIAGGLLDPMNFLRGILIKVFVVIALINGIKAAKAARDIRNLGA
ncbi:MAG: hypothetical protein V4685_08975 [Bacteroidota bacterium]